MAYVVPQPRRQYYGLDRFEILASSNQSSPACLPSTDTCPRKEIFTVSNPEFAAVYAEKIRETIVTAIQALLPDRRWVLNVFRLGYEDEKLQNPIVIQLVVFYDAGPDTGSGSSARITEAEANEIVATSVAAIENSGWNGEEIRVDVGRLPNVSLYAVARG